jgi:FKBP-type peptidyl-prolyl cis-trans isomerase 2
MTMVKPGDTLRIHYTGTLSDGTVFDSSDGRDPLEFTLGAGQVIAGLDAGLEGMRVGEARTLTIPADQAYGPHDPAGRQAVPRGQVPPELSLEVGTMLELTLPEGQVMPVTVAEVTEETVVLDANHPLAGQDLTFVVEMMEIV